MPTAEHVGQLAGARQFRECLIDRRAEIAVGLANRGADRKTIHGYWTEGQESELARPMFGS